MLTAKKQTAGHFLLLGGYEKGPPGTCGCGPVTFERIKVRAPEFPNKGETFKSAPWLANEALFHFYLILKSNTLFVWKGDFGNNFYSLLKSISYCSGL